MPDDMASKGKALDALVKGSSKARPTSFTSLKARHTKMATGIAHQFRSSTMASGRTTA